jgi:hypothetical protein
MAARVRDGRREQKHRNQQRWNESSKQIQQRHLLNESARPKSVVGTKSNNFCLVFMDCRKGKTLDKTHRSTLKANTT